MGAHATFLVDIGATHCFMDEKFANAHGIKQQPTDSTVQLADGSVQPALMQATAHISIQGHKTSILCFIIDIISTICKANLMSFWVIHG